MTSKKRDDRGLWKSVQRQSADDDLDDLLAMSDAELDAFIDSNGGDSKAIRASGKALAEHMLEQRTRLAWHGDMEKKLEAFRATAAASKRTEKLPRAELLARIDAVRKNPRFAEPV